MLGSGILPAAPPGLIPASVLLLERLARLRMHQALDGLRFCAAFFHLRRAAQAAKTADLLKRLPAVHQVTALQPAAIVFVKKSVVPSFVDPADAG